VVDGQNRPLADVIVKVVAAGTNQLMSVTQSHANGVFNAYLAPGKYQLSVIKNGYVWEKYANSLGMEEATIDKHTNYAITMKTINELYPELATPPVHTN
jgi:hypothetical protein